MNPFWSDSSATRGAMCNVSHPSGHKTRKRSQLVGWWTNPWHHDRWFSNLTPSFLDQNEDCGVVEKPCFCLWTAGNESWYTAPFSLWLFFPDICDYWTEGLWRSGTSRQYEALGFMQRFHFISASKTNPAGPIDFSGNVERGRRVRKSVWLYFADKFLSNFSFQPFHLQQLEPYLLEWVGSGLVAEIVLQGIKKKHVGLSKYVTRWKLCYGALGLLHSRFRAGGQNYFFAVIWPNVVKHWLSTLPWRLNTTRWFVFHFSGMH